MAPGFHLSSLSHPEQLPTPLTVGRLSYSAARPHQTLNPRPKEIAMSVTTPPTDQHTIAEPRYSIWGPVQIFQTIAPGIFQVTTASHGGFTLSAERIAEMPTALQKPDGNCFEDDCAWCLVVLSFPAYFPQTLFEEAVPTCKNWFPTEWETWTGTTLDPSESREKRETHSSWIRPDIRPCSRSDNRSPHHTEVVTR